jgi:SAM-dependent methyltransferase
VSHSVRTHLGVRAADYDAAIRTFVPHYSEMIDTVVRWLDGHVPPDALVVDLGAGTGALAGAVLDALPVRLCLVDVDADMLEVAGARLAGHGDRVELRRASFADPLPRCRAVIASLALHHVGEPDDKRRLYRSIREALEPGGLLLVADVAVHAGGLARSRLIAEWSRWMEAHGVEAAAAHFAQWEAEDHYLPLADELELLRAAGFERPECFFRRGPATVFGGFAEP